MDMDAMSRALARLADSEELTLERAREVIHATGIESDESANAAETALAVRWAHDELAARQYKELSDES